MTKRIFATAIAAAVIATSLPTAGAANALTAVPTRTKGQAVYVGSTRVYPTGYNINDSNYFKLRDVGKLAGFGVDWNEDTRTVEISTTRTAPELTEIADTAVTGATAKPTDQRITVDGKEVSMTAYKIKGNNYVKLRDIGKTINFGVSFNMATKAVSIDPNGTYVEEVKPTRSTPTAAAITKWNSTMDEFNEEMIQNHSDKDKLLAIAAKYGPTITGKANGETVKDDTSVSDNQTSTGATVTDAMLRQWEQEMIMRVNEERAKLGAPALVQDNDLMWSAQFWAQHLTTEWRHAVYGEIKELADAQGIPVKSNIEDLINGENITGAGRLTGIGYDPMTIAMNNFMASEGHRNTLLNTDYTRVGIGFAVSADGQIYCCQHFGR